MQPASDGRRFPPNTSQRRKSANVLNDQSVLVRDSSCQRARCDLKLVWSSPAIIFSFVFAVTGAVRWLRAGDSGHHCITMIAMRLMNQTFNLMTLGGLAAAVWSGNRRCPSWVVENIVMHRDSGAEPERSNSRARCANSRATNRLNGFHWRIVCSCR